MVETKLIPAQHYFKAFGEQTTGAETAVLVDSSGHLQVDVISGASTSGTQTDDSAATATVMGCGARYDTAPDDVDDGDAVMLQADVKGRLIVVDYNTATDDAAAPTKGPLIQGKFGASSPDANDAAPVRVGSTGEVMVSDLNTATDDDAAPTVGPLVMGKFGASTPDANDAAPLRCGSSGELVIADLNTATDDSAAKTIGPQVMGVYAAAPASRHDGDAVPVLCDATGKVQVTETSAAASKTALEKIDDWDNVSGAAAGTDGALVMALASSTEPVDVDDNDAVRVWADQSGRVQVQTQHSFHQSNGDSQVSAVPCIIHRVIMSPTAGGVLTVYNNGAEAAPAVLVFTCTAAASAITVDCGGIYCSTGCYVGKDGAWAGDVTVVYDVV